MIRLQPFLQLPLSFWQSVLSSVGALKAQPSCTFKPGETKTTWRGTEGNPGIQYLTSIRRLCLISLLCPSIMWSPESTTRSGWNSSRLDTNTSSMLRAPLDRSWEKMKRLAAGALTRPHCSPGVEQTAPSVCELVYSWAKSHIQQVPSAARKAILAFRAVLTFIT